MGLGLQIWQDYVETGQQEEVTLTQLGAMSAERMHSKIRLIDLHLRDILDRIQSAAPNSVESLQAVAGTVEMHQLLQARRTELNTSDAFLVFDMHGDIVNSSRAFPVQAPLLNISEREYFRYFRDHNDTALFVNPVITSIVTGQPTLYLARRITGPDGAFVGVVVTAMDITALRESEGLFVLPYGHSMTLLRSDGTILMRQPDAPSAIGQKLPHQQWYQLAASQGGALRTQGAVTKGPIFISVTLVKGYPLVINVALPERTVFAKWRQSAMVMTWVGIFAAIGFGQCNLYSVNSREAVHFG